MTALAAAWLTARSLSWPLFHDPPLMHYIASRILAGDVPYRDLFDMNLPGVYLVHLVVLRGLGPGDAAFRVFDLLVLAGILTGLAVALRGFGWWAAASGPALFWLYHLAAGPWGAGQRDYLVCLPLAWMLAALLPILGRSADGPSPRPSRTAWRLGLAGLAVGGAACLKPYPALLAPVVLWAAWRAPASPGPPRGRGARLLAAALGLAVPPVAAVAWLASTGALAPFWSIATGYLLPLYSRLARRPVLGSVLALHRGPSLLALLAGAPVAGVLGLVAARRVDARLAVLGAGVAYGVAHYAIQGKGWEYHLYPLALFAFALGAAGLGAASDAGRGRITALLAAALLAGAVPALLLKARETHADPVPRATRARAEAVAREIRPLVVRGETVQVLDTTAGGVHALFLAGARQPTRFLYDFHFQHDLEAPAVQALRAELMAALGRRPPAAVVVFERGWPSGGYERLERFPGLARWLAEGYVLALTGDGFRLYAARGDR